jgi:hypothetical protein
MIIQERTLSSPLMALALLFFAACGGRNTTSSQPPPIAQSEAPFRACPARAYVAGQWKQQPARQRER